MKTNKKPNPLRLSLAAAAVVSIAVPLTIISGSAGVDSGHFWVKAQYSDNPEIKAFAGINGVGKTEGENPGGETPGGGDSETPGAGTGEIKVATYTCGPTELKVTQEMIDHSKKNQALLDAGKADEMVPYPKGGWNVIIDVSNVDPSLSGVLLSSDGAINFGTTTNDSGPSAIFTSGSTCNMHGVVNGEYHSENGPVQVTAVNDVVTELHYMVNNEYHRVGGPAKLTFENDGTPTLEEWHVNGKLHRDGGPAVSKWSSGELTLEEWYTDGKKHRDGGPAVSTWSSGELTSQEWYETGKLHRTDGPAKIVYATPYQAQIDTWYLNGEHYRTTTYDFNTSKPSQDEWFKGGEDNRHRDDGPAVVRYNEDGSISTEEYYQNNEYHRDGGPAITYYFPSGKPSSEAWYQSGELHREGGPAQIGYNENGTSFSEKWFLNGKLHRLDGPADYIYEEDRSYMVGQERWFIDGTAIHTKDQLLAAGGDPTNWPGHWE